MTWSRMESTDLRVALGFILTEHEAKGDKRVPTFTFVILDSLGLPGPKTWNTLGWRSADNIRERECRRENGWAPQESKRTLEGSIKN